MPVPVAAQQKTAAGPSTAAVEEDDGSDLEILDDGEPTHTGACDGSHAPGSENGAGKRGRDGGEEAAAVDGQQGKKAKVV